MNAERLLTHFDRISEAPDAIPRLRRFILDLAVRGKITDSDNILRDTKPLGELADFIMGQAPAGHTCNNRGEGTLFVKVGEFGARFPEEKAWTTQPIKFAREGDVLICVVGATVGKLNMAVDCAIGRSVAAIRPTQKLNTTYLYYSLMPFTLSLRESARGSAQGVISKPDLAAIPMWCPSITEQLRVVTKVDELMALCDRLEAAQAERESRRDRLAVAVRASVFNSSSHIPDSTFFINNLTHLTTKPEHIQQLRQTILNLAVRGQLVPQDPQDEPAAELLKRIEAEKARLVNEGAIKRPQLVLPIEAAEIPSAVPESWEWVRVRELLFGDSQNGYSKKPDDAPDGIPILRINAGTVRRDGIVAEEECKLIGGISLSQQEQYELQPGDLLACRFNGNRSFVGRLSLYLGYLGIKPIYPDKLIRLRLLSTFVLPKLVRCFAESTVIRKGIETFCATTVGNWGISASNLKNVIIPLPPLAEQHRIVAKVDELMVLCDRLEAQLTTTQTESRRLLEAVLHEALSA
jgi:type I restriction enzyme S subunit